MNAAFDQLASHLRTQDPDSQIWADGDGAERADELLAAFEADDWIELCANWKREDAKWRTCLAGTLIPNTRVAAELLLDMTSDPDRDVSLEALSIVAFYCGANESTKGPFFDKNICIPGFSTRAKLHPQLRSRVKDVASPGAYGFLPRFGLLADLLAGQCPDSFVGPK